MPPLDLIGSFEERDAKRPGVVREQIVVREYMGLTVLFDHDVTDGAPVARFIKRLQELMKAGYGLSEA